MRMRIWSLVWLCLVAVSHKPAMAFFFGLDRGTCVAPEYRDRLKIESFLRSDDTTLSYVEVAPSENLTANNITDRLKAPINPRLILSITDSQVVGGDVSTDVSRHNLISDTFGYIIIEGDRTSNSPYYLVGNWKHPFSSESSKTVLPMPPVFEPEVERRTQLGQLNSSINGGKSLSILFGIDDFHVVLGTFKFESADLIEALRIARSHAELLVLNSRLDNCQRPLAAGETERQSQIDTEWMQQCRAMLPRINADRLKAGVSQRNGSGKLSEDFCGSVSREHRTNERRSEWLERNKLIKNTLGDYLNTNGREYQKLFDTELRKRRFPDAVFAVCLNNGPRYSAWFAPIPSQSFAFYSHHGLTDEDFFIKGKLYSAHGFRLSWRNRLQCDGKVYNQAVWTKQ